MTSRDVQPLRALTARDLRKSYGAETVLDGLSLSASPGQPLGLVGENGSGKSTLLRLLAGIETPDDGVVVRPLDLSYVPQSPAFAVGATVGSVLADALSPLHALQRRFEALALRIANEDVSDEYARAFDRMVVHDAWDVDRRAAIALRQCGLDVIAPESLVSSLSGGQRRRLALAALMVKRPTCVLLDEPTNHLDDVTIGRLEDFLAGLPGVVVVASHDRVFLQNVCRQVFDLDPSHFGMDGHGGKQYAGNYSAYRDAKRAARQRWEQAYGEQRRELTALRAAAATKARHVAHNRGPTDNDKFVYHFKGQNVARTISRRVKDAERRIEDIERGRIPRPPAPLTFQAALTARARSGRVVQVRELVVAHRLTLPVLDVDSGDKVLVTGANGSGKSTLLQVLAGQLRPTSGTAVTSADRVALLPQDVMFKRAERTPAQIFAGLADSGSSLEDFGLLHPRDLRRPVGALSEGQRRRLALALVIEKKPDLLLLDEPTNHISLSLAEELEAALRRSLGTVVIASHDRWMRRRWAGLTVNLPALQP